jgi:hypothetical protein
MVVVNMNLMLPKTIGREAHLRAKGLSRLSKDTKSKASKHLKKGRIKGIKGVYEGGRGRCAT